MTDKVLIDRSVLEQEPVAFMYEYAEGWTTQLRFDGSKPLQVIPLYTRPQPKRQPLTDAQINAFFEGMESSNGFWLSFARAIERAHGIVGE